MELKLDDTVICHVKDGFGELILNSLAGKKDLVASGEVDRFFPWDGGPGSLNVHIRISAVLSDRTGHSDSPDSPDGPGVISVAPAVGAETLDP